MDERIVKSWTNVTVFSACIPLNLNDTPISTFQFVENCPSAKQTPVSVTRQREAIFHLVAGSVNFWAFSKSAWPCISIKENTSVRKIPGLASNSLTERRGNNG